MASGSSRSRASRAPGLRARALWAFVLAGVGLSATAIGIVQYMRSGVVSIRPGRDPLAGSAAVEALVVLFVISAGFAVFGLFLRSRAKRYRASGDRARLGGSES
jgi:hypothetical protein